MTSPIPLATLIDEMTEQLSDAGLIYGHGTANAREDAEFLTLETLDLPETTLDDAGHFMVADPDIEAVQTIIQKRIQTRAPSPYLVKRAWLVGVPFYIDERAIVPRSFIAEIMADGFFDGGDGALIDDPSNVTRVLDLCTGSGCLAILAADVFQKATIDAVDLSDDALAVAKINVDRYGLQDRINLIKGNLFTPLAGKKYDLILTNPPYVTPASMAALPPEYRHEPAIALAGGGDDGMGLVARILQDASAYLKPGGGIMAEIGAGRAAIETRFPHLPFSWLETTNSDGEVFWLDSM
jgi:ribosomal protein L3 glutamine methyltransferase